MALLSFGSGSGQLCPLREHDGLHESPHLLRRAGGPRGGGDGLAGRGIGVDLEADAERALERLWLALDRERRPGVVDREAAALERAPNLRLRPLVGAEQLDPLCRNLGARWTTAEGAAAGPSRVTRLYASPRAEARSRIGCPGGPSRSRRRSPPDPRNTRTSPRRARVSARSGDPRGPRACWRAGWARSHSRAPCRS